jgi:hypothetical protein
MWSCDYPWLFSPCWRNGVYLEIPNGIVVSVLVPDTWSLIRYEQFKESLGQLVRISVLFSKANRVSFY